MLVCDQAKDKLEKSMVADNESGKSIESEVRTSSGMFLNKAQVSWNFTLLALIFTFGINIMLIWCSCNCHKLTIKSAKGVFKFLESESDYEIIPRDSGVILY